MERALDHLRQTEKEIAKLLQQDDSPELRKVLECIRDFIRIMEKKG